MSTGTLVLLIVLGVLSLLAVGGAIAAARRTHDRAPGLRAQVEEADRALAVAHAEDKGWERSALEAAARAAFAERHGDPGAIRELHLVAVLDRPGTDDDQAVFRAETVDGEREIVLGRRGGRWVAAG